MDYDQNCDKDNPDTWKSTQIKIPTDENRRDFDLSGLWFFWNLISWDSDVSGLLLSGFRPKPRYLLYNIFMMHNASDKVSIHTVGYIERFVNFVVKMLLWKVCQLIQRIIQNLQLCTHYHDEAWKFHRRIKCYWTTYSIQSNDD